MNRKQRFVRFCSLVVLSCVSGQTLSADITMAKLFTDHMVLQRESQIKIWGTAEPNKSLVVSFIDEVVECQADANGRWSALIKTGAAGGPYTLEVRAKQGEPRIVLSDVLVGEVWICSGQSNMQWPVRAAAFAEKEIDGAGEHGQLRLFTIAQNVSTTPIAEFDRVVGWDVCSPKSITDFSAVAYAFGRHVSRELNVPVGLINVSWGGTSCEAWTSRGALEANDEFQAMLEHWETVAEPLVPNRPSNLFNGMIAPLRGIKFRGAIWYQGESNVGRGYQYRSLFATMIADWRRQLAAGEPFPFYFVQIAPFRYGNRPPAALAELWDAQLHVFRHVPNVGMAVTTDIGDLADIHPANKQEVGRRLGLWAVHHQGATAESQSNTVPSGPIYREMAIDGAQIRIKFDYVGDGLMSATTNELTWFTICSEDQKFVSAQAIIDGDEVVVWSDQIEKPIAVRFAWDDSAVPNLFNKAGLPASPFRTDDFELLSRETRY